MRHPATLRAARAVLAATLLAVPLFAASTPVARPAITGIAWVRFAGLPNGASDDFFQHELGLPRTMAGTTSVFQVSSTQSVQIVPRPTVPGDQLLKIALYTADLHRMSAYLASKGVASTTDADGLEVLDPEGHHLVFRQGGPEAPPAPGAYPTQISHRLIHAGIIVHDRPAEDRFYHDILGCRLYWQGGFKDGLTDWVNMQVPDGSDWIEYMLNISPTADSAQLGSANHISLGVPSIEKTATFLAANGWQRPANGGTHLGQDGKWQISLRDPLNSRIEVMEFTPVRTPCCSPFTGNTPHD